MTMRELATGLFIDREAFNGLVLWADRSDQASPLSFGFTVSASAKPRIYGVMCGGLCDAALAVVDKYRTMFRTIDHDQLSAFEEGLAAAKLKDFDGGIRIIG